MQGRPASGCVGCHDRRYALCASRRAMPTSYCSAAHRVCMHVTDYVREWVGWARLTTTCVGRGRACPLDVWLASQQLCECGCSWLRVRKDQS